MKLVRLSLPNLPSTPAHVRQLADVSRVPCPIACQEQFDAAETIKILRVHWTVKHDSSPVISARARDVCLTP